MHIHAAHEGHAQAGAHAARGAQPALGQQLVQMGGRARFVRTDVLEKASVEAAISMAVLFALNVKV